MQDSNVAKTYVRPDNTAVLTCPHCRRQKVVIAEAFKGRKHKLKIKCACQSVFMVILEFRKRIRKPVNLRGTYINLSQDESTGALVIKDISVCGFAFSTFDGKKFNIGDELSIEFILDDEYNTDIRKEAVVRNIRPDAYGCEFEKHEDAFGSPLGYYIMPK